MSASLSVCEAGSNSRGTSTAAPGHPRLKGCPVRHQLPHRVARLVPPRAFQLPTGGHEPLSMGRAIGFRSLAAPIQFGLQASRLINSREGGNVGRAIAEQAGASFRLRRGTGRKPRRSRGHSGEQQPSPTPQQSLHPPGSFHRGSRSGRSMGLQGRRSDPFVVPASRHSNAPKMRRIFSSSCRRTPTRTSRQRVPGRPHP